MGRAPSCGRGSPPPLRAEGQKSGPRGQCQRGAASSISAWPERMDSGRLAPRFNLDVVVQLVGRVPVAIETKITTLHALGVNELALVGFDVIQVFPRAKANLVFEVVVEDGGHA